MLCERCQQRPAMVQYTEIINGQKRVMQLCDTCAREVQAESFGFFPQLNLPNFLAGFFHHFGAGAGAVPQAPVTHDRCASCGLPESEFVQRGLLGCGNCYNSFAERLDSVIRRIHGTTRHTGKVPARTGGRARVVKEIEQLKQRLKEAVSREEYEKAAQLRDEIRELEKKLGREG